jgi:hypothetical protein
VASRVIAKHQGHRDHHHHRQDHQYIEALIVCPTLPRSLRDKNKLDIILVF